MTQDPCKHIDPAVLDLIDLTVWLPSELGTDTIEQVSSDKLGVWKPPCSSCAVLWAPVFAMTFVCCDEGFAFETFGVN